MDTGATGVDAGPNDVGVNRARVWPGVALVLAFWACRVALVSTGQPLFRQFMGTLVASGLLMIAFLCWWTIDRRGRRGERLAGVLAWLGFGVLAGVLSFKTLGVMPLILTAMPWVFTAWALWAVVGRGAGLRVRRRGQAVVVAVAWGVFTLFRMDGLDGAGGTTLSWRWSETAEQRYLARQSKAGAGKAKVATTTATTGPVEASAADWPEFRGVRRDGVVRGLSIATDWNATPPKLLWKIPVGPGWSSISVVGNRAYTQEQRGTSQEAVVCRDATTGAEVWAYADAARFDESMAGPGPRSTPTFHDGRLYAQGATGLLNCLDAASGAKVWQKDVAADSKAKLPIWGYVSSPLIVDGKVIVFAGGEGSNGLLAYDAKSGERAWSVAAGIMCYGSPQLETVGGEAQVLMWSDVGLLAVEPRTGSLRWQQQVGTGGGMPRSIQPHAIGAGQLVVASEGDSGTALLDVAKEGNDWRALPRWQTTTFRPSFNDFVVKGDFLYGLDGGSMCCVDLKAGKRVWRKGKYGSGQLLLLEEQGVLLVLCENGEVALVAAKPEGHQELARMPAIEGKAWNHPAIARGKLYVRSGEEMACFELRRAGQ